MFRKIAVCAALAAGFAFTPALAGSTYTWTGAADNRWTNAANWTVGGAAASVCPGVVWDGVTGTPGYPTGDTAVFGASSVSTIDCSGLYSVYQLKVTGADAPAYTFTTTDTWPAISLEPNGTVLIDATVANDQTMGVAALANLSNAGSADATACPASYGSSTYFRNNSAKTLHFTRFDAVRHRPGHSNKWQDTNIYFSGNGDFDLSGSFGSLEGTCPWLFLQIVNKTFWVRCDMLGVRGWESSNGNTLSIAAGCTASTSPTINTPRVVAANNTFTIDGPGTFSVGENHGGISLDRMGYVAAASGATTLRINCPLVVARKSPYKTANLHLWSSGGTVIIDTPSTDIPGTVGFAGGSSGTVAFPATNKLGNVTGFVFGSGGTVRFDGADDESLVLPLVYTGAVCAVVKNGGTGTLTVASEISASSVGTGATAEFCGASGRIAFAPTFGAVTPKAVRFSGAAGVELAAAAAAALPDGTGLEVNGGTTLRLTDAAAYGLPALANVSGANTVRIADGATVTLDGLAVTAGSLDLVFDIRKTAVTVTGMGAGDAVTGLKVNGRTAGFGAGGRVLQNPTAVDTEIAAKGDTVPDDATKGVGITSEGTGANTVLATDATAVKALANQQAAAATVAIAAGQTLTADRVALDALAGDFTVGETAGVGTLAVKTLHNEDTNAVLTVNAAIGGGTFTATGPGVKRIRLAGTLSAGQMDFAEGTTAFEGGLCESTGADLTVTNGAKLVFGAGAGFVAPGGLPTATSGAIRVGRTGRGTLTIGSGAAVTNRILTGDASLFKDMVSAVYLRGGDVYPCPDGGIDFFGKYGHTYWGIRSGTLTFRKNCNFGSGNGQHYGLITQTGGRVVDLGGGGSFRFGVGFNHVTDWYVCGGTFVGSRGLNLGDWGGYSGYLAVLTVDGTADFTSGGTVQGAYWNSKSARTLRGILNVNGNGVLRGTYITRNGYSYPFADQRKNDRIYVNFDGGTFQGRSNAGYVFGNVAETSHVDRVTLFARGLKFDTYGKIHNVAVPLEAPTGKGVASVAWNDELTDLIAPPVVKIVDPSGAGEGASAHALLDEESGRVTNIVVTSRGWGYVEGTRAEVAYGYANSKIYVPVTLADNVSGGLTVYGGGTMNLLRTNTYAGATTVSNATLTLNCDDAIASASKLVLEKDGKLNLNNKTQTFADIETKGGTVLNGKPLVSGLTVDFAEASAGRVKALDLSLFTFAPGAALTLANFDAAALEKGRRYRLASWMNGTCPALDLTAAAAQLPEGWRLVQRETGLRLSPVTGTTLLIR